MGTALLGLRTVVYQVNDRVRARDWYAAAFGIEPYFDEAFYVGFNIGGYELGLDPNASRALAGNGTSITYWGVKNLDAALAQLVTSGAAVHEPARDVGEKIRVAAIKDPFGNVLGLIENPGFTLTA